MYNPRNLQRLSQDNVDLKIQEKIAFDRISGSFIREIPLTSINRKKFKLSGHVISILNLRFDYSCRACNQSWIRNETCSCRDPLPFVNSSVKQDLSLKFIKIFSVLHYLKIVQDWHI